MSFFGIKSKFGIFKSFICIELLLTNLLISDLVNDFDVNSSINSIIFLESRLMTCFSISLGKSLLEYVFSKSSFAFNAAFSL